MWIRDIQKTIAARTCWNNLCRDCGSPLRTFPCYVGGDLERQRPIVGSRLVHVAALWRQVFLSECTRTRFAALLRAACTAGFNRSGKISSSIALVTTGVANRRSLHYSGRTRRLDIGWTRQVGSRPSSVAVMLKYVWKSADREINSREDFHSDVAHSNSVMRSHARYNAHCSRHSITPATRCKSLKHTSPRPCSNRGRNNSFPESPVPASADS